MKRRAEWSPARRAYNGIFPGQHAGQPARAEVSRVLVGLPVEEPQTDQPQDC